MSRQLEIIIALTCGMVIGEIAIGLVMLAILGVKKL